MKIAFGTNNLGIFFVDPPNYIYVTNWDNFLDPQMRAKKIGGASFALMQLLAL